MLSDEEVLARFTDFKNRFTQGGWRRWWMQDQVRDNYSAVEGFAFGDDGYNNGQWLDGELTRRNADSKPSYIVNKLSRLVDGVSGFQIQNRSDTKVIPREVAEQGQEKSDSKTADLANDAVEYIGYEARKNVENSSAYRDMLICGVGAVDNVIDYDTEDTGQPCCTRIAPYLLLWDVAARKKNLTDANAVASAEIYDRDALIEEVEEATGKTIVSTSVPSLGCDEFAEYFLYTNEDNLALKYSFQWREKTTYYKVENTIAPLLAQNDLLMELAVVMKIFELAKENYGFDLAKDELLNIESKDRAKFKEAFEALGAPFNATKSRKYKYYRAEIVGDNVISKSENYSQRMFSLQFMTGKWSETRQCFYGLVSVSKDPQRLLNKAISDFSELLYTSPHGGVMMESDAVDDLGGFLDTWAKQREVTILRPGSIASNKVMLKPQASISPAIITAIEYAERSILECPGLTQEFFGIADGGDNQAAMLQSQRVRQGLIVLAVYMDAMTEFSLRQTRLFIDQAGVLAENNNGYVIRQISSKRGQFYRLMKDDLAKEFDIIVKEVPKTPDEREREAKMLLDIAGIITQSGGNGAAITPLIVENMDIAGDKIEDILKLIAPAPPPPPDPLQQALLEAQVNQLNANAENLQAAAKEKSMNMIEIQARLGDVEAKSEEELNMLRADIEKIKSEIAVNVVKAVNGG
jgi:hypothetical protein